MQEPYKTWIPLGFALTLFGAYLVYSSFGSDTLPATSVDLPASVQSAMNTVPQREVPAGAKEYASLQYKFSLLYPEDLVVQEYSEEGGARTIIFQNTEVPNGFQLYVLPYHESTITEKRFRMDVPSGVRKGETIIDMDGVKASKFYSKHALLGDTVEVWAIHDGFLYEINTHKNFEALIDEVVSHWKFI